jgi:HPt (histidine-containing phosphotransfer) domain-containing protein
MHMREIAQETCVLDLEALTQRCLGNTALVDRVLKRFAVQLNADLVELERALQGGDLPTFALVSHRIKGMSANVEARELRRLAADAEQLALQQKLSQATEILPELQAERDRIAASLSLTSSCSHG